MPSLLDVAFIVVPLALAAALSFALRRRGVGTQALIRLAGFPALYVATIALTLLISFQVLGIDLVD